MQPKEISREKWDAAQLAQDHKANWVHEHKKLIVEQAGAPYAGDIEVSRWEAVSLEESVPEHEVQLGMRFGYFDYESSTDKLMHWHLNFANREVFVGYGDGLLAQDEVQCLEHPVLANVREALVASPVSRPLTVEYHQPTPILVAGAERRCSLDTVKIYGQKLATATTETVLESTHVINPPTVSNIIAMEAPYGRGLYQLKHINYILTTTVTGFAAAIRESGDRQAVIHTGFWGCGAYGGNPELMAFLQILAARIAKVYRMVFYYGDDLSSYIKGYSEAYSLRTETDLSKIIKYVYDSGYIWGMGNGT